MDFCRLGASSMERETGVQPVGRTGRNNDNAGPDDQPLAFGLHDVHSTNFYKSRPAFLVLCMLLGRTGPSFHCVGRLIRTF
jgi:hypothetical protein